MRLAVVSLFFVVACGTSDSAPDATTAIDATVVADATDFDANAPDAFDPCPGETPFEVGVVDWNSAENVAGVAAQERGDGNAASSAPNGRVVLCVSGTGPIAIRFTKVDYVDRVHTTTVEAIAAQYATGVAPSFRMLRTTDADALYISAGETRAATAATVIAMPTNAATGAPLAGVTVGIAAENDGAYTPDGTGIVTGDTSLADGKVVFLNAALGAGSTEASATGPTSCEVPASVTLEAGVSSVSIACQP
tara:strand:+ start:33800 stop:34549 length:750 start_codon:yes stop_codon:yes gene_type:complete